LVLPTGTPVFNLKIPGLVVILWALWAFYPGMKLPGVFVFWLLGGFLGFHGSILSSIRGTFHPHVVRGNRLHREDQFHFFQNLSAHLRNFFCHSFIEVVWILSGFNQVVPEPDGLLQRCPNHAKIMLGDWDGKNLRLVIVLAHLFFSLNSFKPSSSTWFTCFHFP